MRLSKLGLLFVLLGAALTAACGPATVRSASFPDPDVACPGARLTWTLQVEDQRADRVAQERMTAAVKDAVQKSFPGCRWGASDPETGTIGIEIHRFASRLDAGSWEAAVEWTVAARDAGGHTVTQFEVNEEVSRPNYQGSDNEKESLSEAFQKAVQRTARGLTALSISEIFRPPQGTAAEAGSRLPNRFLDATTRSAGRGCVPVLPELREDGRVERFSQPCTSEDL